MRIGREQHVPDSIACTQNQTSRVWAVRQHTLFECSPQPPSHTLSKFSCGSGCPTRSEKKKKKTHSLTLLLQNHLDHFNNLLLDPWYRKMHVHPCCHLTPAPRFPPGSLTLAHPRSASQQDSARAPVALAAHRPRSAAQGLEDQVHQAHLITPSKDNVPTPIRVNKTYKERFSENRHMSMRIVARFS